MPIPTCRYYFIEILMSATIVLGNPLRSSEYSKKDRLRMKNRFIGWVREYHNIMKWRQEVCIKITF